MQLDGLGLAMVTQMVPTLSPHTDQSQASSAHLDTEAVLARGSQHIVALHTITALLTADASAVLAPRLGGAGVLSAVLDSLAERTEQRLLAPPQFQLQNFRLIEAHLIWLQVRGCLGAVALSCEVRF
jgi:hypothetical protein